MSALYRLTVVRTGARLGRCRVGAEGTITDDDGGGAADAVTAVLRLAHGDIAALDGWTNGYVQLSRA